MEYVNPYLYVQMDRRLLVGGGGGGGGGAMGCGKNICTIKYCWIIYL